MAKKKRDPFDKVRNQCVDHDVRLPTVRPAPKRPETAHDLHDGQVGLLADLWAANGGDLCDRVYSLFGFHPTPEDRAHLYWVVSLNTDWADRLEMQRLGEHGWYARKFERGEYPVSFTPPRRGEAGFNPIPQRFRPRHLTETTA